MPTSTGAKRGPLGQEGARVDAVRQRAVAALQEGQHGRHRAGDALGGLAVELQRLAGRRVARRGLAQAGQAFGAEDPQHQLQRQVGLARVHAARAQEAREVGGARVGGVELRHRRDERQHAAGQSASFF
jgi:hypothetical protein